MSANFYELLKYAQTGIASPDMTYYDKLRASTLMSGVVQTLTGQPPLTFKSDGTPLISWSMKGNGSQTGTPTPDNPVMPTFCGVRTANLFDASNTLYNARIGAEGEIVNDNSCVLSDYISVLPNESYSQSSEFTYSNALAEFDGNKKFIKRYVSGNGKITTSENTRFIRVSCAKTIVDPFMLNAGSTALPYEPFGYKIPLTCAGQTVPVYLGQTQTVRRIKKLVLTGSENWALWSSGQPDVERYYYKWGRYTSSLDLICTHLPFNSSDENYEHIRLGGSNRDDFIIFISKTIAPTLADFKTYLAQQYAAGHPVTVWYVLATPTTGIVNEPLCKIGDYADELSSDDAGVSIPTVKGQNVLTVDTPIQPSEMTITYKG